MSALGLWDARDASQVVHDGGKLCTARVSRRGSRYIRGILCKDSDNFDSYMDASMGAWVGDQESTVNDSAANPCPGAAGTATASTFQVPQS